MMELDLVIFDLSGTTIADDGQVASAFEDTLKANGVEISKQDVDRMRGANKRDIIKTIVRDIEAIDEIYESFRKTLFTRFKEGGIREIAGATQTFQHFRQNGIRMALNTGFDQILTRWILDSTGWDKNLFNAIVCGDQISRGRPAPFMIFRAMEVCSVTNVHRVATVGDTSLDLQAGYNAGVRYNVGVLSGAHSKEQLEREPHTHLLESVALLPQI